MRGFLTPTQRIELIGRHALPYSFIVFLFLLDITAFPFPFSLMFGAPFVAMALYYWAIYRPSLFPLWLAFLTGLLLDMIGGFPLGINALLYSLVHVLLVNQRRFLMTQGFVALWLGFAVFNMAMQAGQWGIMSMFYIKPLPLEAFLQPALLGFLFFPLVSGLLRLTHKIL